MAAVKIQGICKRYGKQSVLSDFQLSIEDGQYVVVLGSSGCGKSTLLKIIAGLVRPDRGSVLLGGRDVTKQTPRDRDVSLLFQSDALYPHLTIEKSIRAGLQKRLSKQEVDERVTQAAEMVDIGELLSRLPQSLSGGERRRAALAKAIARRASVRLLDEPLSAVDAHLTHQISDDLRTWHQSSPGVTIHVTHNGQVAMRMADQIAVMHGGRIVQLDPPEKVFRNPATPEAADAISSVPVSVVEFEGGSVSGAMIEQEGQFILRWDDTNARSKETRQRIGFRASDCQVIDSRTIPEDLKNQPGLTGMVRVKRLRRVDRQTIATLELTTKTVSNARVYAALPNEMIPRADEAMSDPDHLFVCHVAADHLLMFS